MVKKREDTPAPGAPAWTATFGDLMNLLLCFFVMLFAMSTMDQSKYEEIKQSFQQSNNSIFHGNGSVIGQNGGEVGDISVIDPGIGEQVPPESQQLSESEQLNESLETIIKQKKLYSEKIYEGVSDLLEKENLKDTTVGLSIDDDFNYVKLSIAGAILFDSGSTSLKQEAIPILSKLGDILKIYKDYHIEIEGHTDNVPVVNKSHTFKDNYELSCDRALSAFYYLINEKGINPSNLKCSGRGESDPIASNDTPKGRQKNRRIEIKIFNELSKY